MVAMALPEPTAQAVVASVAVVAVARIVAPEETAVRVARRAVEEVAVAQEPLSAVTRATVDAAKSWFGRSVNSLTVS